jgi:hypothetical protein
MKTKTQPAKIQDKETREYLELFKKNLESVTGDKFKFSAPYRCFGRYSWEPQKRICMRYADPPGAVLATIELPSRHIIPYNDTKANRDIIISELIRTNNATGQCYEYILFSRNGRVN